MNRSYTKLVFLLVILSNSGNLFGQTPVISSFTPISGSVGTIVTISGSNFNATAANNIVFFGATKANVTSATSTKLTVVVPTGTIYQPITVLNTTTNRSARSNLSFDVTFGCPTIAFNPKVDYTTGSSPFSAISGDIDGDGKSDLLALNNGGNSFSVFRNTSSLGSVSFATKTDFTTGTSPQSAIFGDVDGDGKLDVAVTYGNFVSVYLNQSNPGTISFAGKVDFATGSTPYSVIIEDLDGDGKNDLSTGNYGANTISVLLNNGNVGSVSFASKVDFSTGSNPRSLRVEDFDNDGKLDLTVVNISSNTVSVLRNTCSIGIPSFSAKVDFPTGTSPRALRAIDVDGDGKIDLEIVNNLSNTISILRNISTSSITSGSFAAKIDFATGSSPFQLSNNDFDGDGLPDIALVINGTNQVSIFRNKSSPGTISFDPSIDYATGSSPFSITSGDWDGDNKPELAVTNNSGSSISVLTNSCIPVPIISSFSPSSGSTQSLITINGNGFSSTNNAVFVGTRRATIQSQSSSTIVIKVPCGSQNDFITVVNLGNGLAAKSTQKFSTTFTASPLSASSFKPAVDVTSGGAINHNRLADLNNDGFLDLIVSNASGSLHIYKNSGASTVGTGTYPVDYALSGGTQFKFTEVADLDGDGKLDIIAVDQGAATSKIFLNTSPSTAVISFSLAATIPTSNCTAAASADMDNDGKLDVVITEYSSGSLRFYRNTSSVGIISFAAGFAIAVSGAHDVDLADWDGDGSVDVLASEESSSQVKIYQNVSNGSSYVLAATISPIPSAYNIDLGDFNNDGKIDFASGRSGQRICLNTSPAPGTFSGSIISTPISGSFGIDMNDLDGDSKLDLSYFSTGPNIAAARNLGGTAGTSFNISAYTGTTFNMTSGDLNCDTYPELVAASISASYTRIIPNLPPIVLTSVSPTTGSLGNVITLSGSNFVNISSVSFGGITASSFVVVNATTITAVVGNGASGVVTVNSSTLGIASLSGFSFIQIYPTITTFLPKTGIVGSVITISGANFDPVTLNNKVRIGGVAANVVFASPTKLEVVVPAGASIGSISVSVAGKSSKSKEAFSVSNASVCNTLSTPTSFLTGNGPKGLAIGDFNNDGDPDIVTANNDVNTISVLLGNGLGALGAKQDYISGSAPNGVAVADLNGDGNQDLVTANYSDYTFSYFEGNGDGTFDPRVNYSTGSLPLGIGVADFNNDGRPDVATANINDFVSIMLALPGGGFAAPVDYSIRANTESLVLGDFDKDGNWDIATLNSSSDVFSVIFGDGTGSFGTNVDYPTNSSPQSLVVGDFNKDGNQDLAVASVGTNTISIYGGSPSGTFSLITTFLISASSIKSLAVGDFNGDGNPDLVSADGIANSITRYIGDGIGNFSSPDIFTADNYSWAVSVADFNKDGKQDIVNINYSASTAYVYLSSCSIATTPPGNLGLYFDGVNDLFSYNSILTNQTDNITIEAWVKPRTVPTGNSILFYNGKYNVDGYGLFIDNTLGLNYSIGGIEVDPTGYSLELNKWTHLALVIEGGQAKIYVNGVYLPSSGWSTPPNVPNGGFVLGSNGTTEFFNGEIDEVRVYQSALIASDIISDMSSQSTSTELAYWNMDDAISDPAADKAYDQTTGGNNVDINNPPASPIWAYRVTNTLDDGNAGSLRWVVNNTNLKSNINYIDFSIQQSSASIVSTIPIVSQIAINNPVILDGYSAYGSYPNTNPLTSGLNTQLRVELNMAGMGSFPDVTGVEITNVDNSIVRGLSIYGISDSGGGRQAMNFINGNNNTVSGCWFGIRADGTSSFNMNGIYFINGSSNVIGYAGNVPDVSTFNIISNCGYQGIAISDNNSIFQGNYIGYGPDGITPAWIGYWGMPLGGSGNIIKNNLIGYSGQYGMRVGGSNSLIQGNMIGIDLNGTQTIENANGIYIFSGTNNTIGGINPGESNIIANGNDYGIRIDGSGVVGHIISGNSIFWNTSGGIGLVNGGNNDKPAPAITSAYTNAVSGTCQSGDIIQIFYDSPQSGTTDQGRIYLGQTTAIGTNWSFTATLTTGSRITVTATDGVNGTSAFSIAAIVTGAIPTYYRSIASGNWNDYTKWEGSIDGITYSPLSSGQYPGALSIGNVVSISGGTIITGAVSPPYSLASLTVNGTWFPGANTYTISGQTLILSGGIYNNNATATKTYFLGNVVIQSGGKFLTDANAYQEFQNGFVNNTSSYSDFSMSGQTKFTVNNQVISGTATFTYFNDLIAVGNDIIVENQSTYISLSGATTSLVGLNANSTWRLGNAGTIYSYSNVEIMNGGLLNATLPGTFVAYLGNGQKIKNTNYYGLNIGNSGVKIVEGLVNVVNFGNISGFATLSFSGAALSVLSVTGNFYLDASVGSSVDISGGGYAHRLYLGGSFNTITGIFIKGNSKIIYNGAVGQNVIALNYSDVEFSGAGLKSLTGPTLASTVSMNNGIVDLGIYNLTTTSILPTTAYSATNMIRQTGFSSGGILVKSGNSSGDYLMVYPIGTGSIYSPIEIQDLPTFTSISNIGIQIINTTGGANMVNRMFSLSSSGIGNLAYIDIIFSFDPSEKVGTPTNVHVYNPAKNSLINDVVQATTFNTTGTFINIPIDGLWVAESNPIATQPTGNRGIYFDGIDDYVSAPVPLSTTLDFTIEAWVKLSRYPTANAMIAANGNTNLDGCGMFVSNTGSFNVVIGGAGIINTDISIGLNEWTHLSIVRESGIWKYYKNGVAGNRTGGLSNNASASSPTGFFIGNAGTAFIDPYPGQIDEVKVFNTARSASQIIFDMGSTAIGTAGLVSYWNFEDDAAAGIQTTASDVKGGINGTLTNGPLWALRVTNNTDNGTAGLGSLRQAINDANTDLDKDYIDFSLSSGTQTIQPTTTYTLNNPILIDGYSQLNTIPGENSMANTNAFGLPINAKLNVVINGAIAGSSDAFLLASNNAEIKGLVVNGYSGSTAFNFSNAFSNIDYNKISGCFIGTNRDGTTAVSNNYGFQATGPSFIRSGNTIGGINQADRNLISGNSIGISDFNTWYNGLIQNNYIGTNAAGSAAIPNFGGGGIEQLLNSNNVIIANNVISGNAGTGIFIASASSGNHVIRGNRIGTTADGQSSLPNGANGITIFNNSNNTIGGLGIGDANIIANNGVNGVSIQFYGVNNIVLNNTIYGNASSGIYLIDYGNNGKAAPSIVNAFTDKIYGTCQSGDLVEVFYDSPQFGTTDQGRVYIGQATTIGINWSFAATLTVGSRITATGTDGVNGTSPFSPAATVTSAVAAAALDFDGVDDYVDIPNNASLNSLPMTVECWVKTTSTSLCYEGLLNKYYASSFNGWSLFRVNNLVYVYYYVSPSDFIAFPSNGTIPINDGSWHHIAMVVEATGGKIYIDGALSGSGAWIGNPSTCTTLQNLSIGLYPGNIQSGCTGGTPGLYNGSIDEVRIWNRALCQSEITNNLNCEKPGDLTGLIAKYDFNQGFAGVSNPLETSLVDSSGNGNIGTLYNFGLSGNSSNWILSSPITTSSICIPFTKPVISVTGKTNPITNGSLIPNTLDGTDFGLASGVVTRNFTIKNSGVSPLTINSIYLGNGIDFSTPVIALAPVIAVGDTFQFSVTYFYNGGNSIDTVKITSNDCSTPLYSFVIQASTPGAALDFDGVDDLVRLPDNDPSWNMQPNFTLEIWVYPRSSSDQLIVYPGGCNLDNPPYCLFIGTNNTTFIYPGAGDFKFTHDAFGPTEYLKSDGLAPLNTWSHIAITYDGQTFKMYLNGVLQAKTLSFANVITRSNVYRFLGADYYSASYSGSGCGGTNPRMPFNGKLDEFRIWSRALCQTEIQGNMNYEKPSNLSGLEAKYDFNHGFAGASNLTETTLVDSSVSGNNGTLNNFALNGSNSNWVAPGAVLTGSTTTSVTCLPGAALNFYGSSNYVSTNLWSTSLKNITMEASVYWNGTTGANQQIMLNGNSGSNGYAITIQGGAGGDALSILQGGSAWISSSVVLSTNSWHHIAAVNDNGTWSLYLDGTPLSIVSNTAIPNSIAGVSNSFIGSNQLGQENFNGTIDNVRFWNRPLCLTEISAHMGCERPASSAGLIARYDFNSGIAGQNNVGFTSAIDSSGSNNHGSLNNFILTSTISNWVTTGAVISGSTCSGISVPVGSTWTWVGGNSSDWFSPCNWDKLAVPDATSDVVIPGGTIFAPTITGSPAYCNTILINTGNGGIVNLDSSGGGALNVTQ